MARNEPSPPKTDEPEVFTPEAGEIEPAGGIVRKPPAPSEPEDKPAEGDKR